MSKQSCCVLLLSLGALIASPSFDDEKSSKLDGNVRYYDPGKRIGITIRPQVEKTYDLSSKDTTYLVDPDIQVGSKVVMEEKKDENGKKLVVIKVKSPKE